MASRTRLRGAAILVLVMMVLALVPGTAMALDGPYGFGATRTDSSTGVKTDVRGQFMRYMGSGGVAVWCYMSKVQGRYYHSTLAGSPHVSYARLGEAYMDQYHGIYPSLGDNYWGSYFAVSPGSPGTWTGWYYRTPVRQDCWAGSGTTLYAQTSVKIYGSSGYIKTWSPLWSYHTVSTYPPY